MATEILAIGADAAESNDVVVTTPLTVGLKRAGSGPVLEGASTVEIRVRDDDAVYWTIGRLNYSAPAMILAGPGTYKFFRLAGGKAVGVFSA